VPRQITPTQVVLLLMLVAVFVIAGRVWWATRGAPRKRR
jgi:preprotein translocase subunit Sec61beta